MLTGRALKIWLLFPHMAARGAALHFNRALVYSLGHTHTHTEGENHTVTLSSPREIKTASLTETLDLADKLEVIV